MPLGPGKYDKECTEIREKTKAEGVVLIVFGGEDGMGFSCQVNAKIMFKLPEVFRIMAKQIEKDIGGIGK